MTWTTSADPWPNGIRREVERALRPALRKYLTLDAKFRQTAVPALAVAHFCLLAILTPSLAAPEACALMLLSGAVLLFAAVAAIPDRQVDKPAAASAPQASKIPAVSEVPAGPAPIWTSEIALAPRECRSAARRTCAVHTGAHHSNWADLMSRVSHELRTPLNAVLGFSDMMDRGTFGPLGHHRYQEYARHIHQSGRDLLKSAEDTLAVTSLLAAPSRPAATEVVDVADLAADAWAFFGRLAAARNVALAIDVPPATEIICDRRGFRQVLVNLLSEALSRSSAGTAIRLTVTFESGMVGVIVAVPRTSTQVRREPGSLDVCLARTLLDFHGAPLFEHLSEQSGWCATTYLERADQTDFFSSPACAHRHSVHA